MLRVKALHSQSGKPHDSFAVLDLCAARHPICDIVWTIQQAPSREFAVILGKPNRVAGKEH
jgi:hypothetical protein